MLRRRRGPPYRGPRGDVRELDESSPLGYGFDDLRGAEAGRSEAGRSHDVVRAVREQDRAADVFHQRLEIHRLHCQAGLPHRVRGVLRNHVAHVLEDVRMGVDEVCADGLDRERLAEVVDRAGLGHLSPRAEEGPSVGVAPREGAIRTASDDLVRVLRGKREAHHAPHRRSMGEHPLDAESVE
jgi:hypothetical protein